MLRFCSSVNPAGSSRDVLKRTPTRTYRDHPLRGNRPSLRRATECVSSLSPERRMRSRLPVYCPESAPVRSSSPPKSEEGGNRRPKASPPYTDPLSPEKTTARTTPQVTTAGDQERSKQLRCPPHAGARPGKPARSTTSISPFSRGRFAAARRKRHAARMIQSQYARRYLIRHRIKRHLRALPTVPQNARTMRLPLRQETTPVARTFPRQLR